MARKNRVWNPQMFDHVVMRGNNRQDIFKNKSDITEFIRVLHYAYMKYPFMIIAYCIMTNHYHLLIRSPEAPLGKVMALINRRYTEYYKRKYNYSGYLYDRRYFAEMVASPKSLLTVSRYIHRNPIETTVPMVERLEQYPYSSYPMYFNKTPPPFPFLDLDLLPTFLPPNYKQTESGYCEYCIEDKEETANTCTQKHLQIF